MSKRSKLEELIIAYLSDELDDDEEAFVIQWINSSEENKNSFREIEKSFHLLSINREVENIDIEVEWEKFRDSVSFKDQEYSESEVDIQEPVSMEIGSNKRKFPSRIVVFVLAASLILFFGIRLGWFLNDITPDVNVSGDVAQGKIDRPLPVFHHEKNDTGKDKEYSLGDGTKVVLSSNSELSYMVPFPGDRREISLSGKAYFKIAKDTLRPFSVISSYISTTAVGTEFLVNAFEKSNEIIVRLIEGKVMVKSAPGVEKMLESDIYLLPGEELVFNKLQRTAKLKKISPAKNAIASNKDNIALDKPEMPKFERGSWYMFNNQSLADVFKQLEVIYQTEIDYSEKDIANIYFIGKFDKKDSLEVILKRITSINNLKLTSSNNKHTITK